ncbi:MAG TPA: 5-formyltetrahydrofolate cyclo-ligase [Oscillospiraceae bacterium]|nr:5-formyltetrahydrofolate cyclo-ligase [Oscillospiraceae bacterium]HPK35851.1 5-formyltetrahydrofolate cyclo-ligase [Oscillospiraceae bacterium]HPR76016.1 5-formyltetrahydrofolate cyclo-ligase [Oscillospiraceae bacterium]
MRAWALRTAHAISEQRRGESDLAAMQRLLSLKAFQEAKTVFCYVSVGDEVSTRDIIKTAIGLHKTVCVPRCLPDYAMEAVAINDIEELENGLYGIPTVKKEGNIIPTSMIDLTVLPCLCADAEGYRIGYGKGYYDRFLTDYKGFSVVLCRKELLVDQIPVESHDQKVDFVIAT